MKKIAFWTLAALMTVAFAGCDDDNDSGGKKAVNGSVCSINDDCISDYCDAATHVCAVKPVVESKKANGVSCTSAAECESDYCDAVSHVCAVNPVVESKKANGVSCTSAAECESDYCDAATHVCAVKPVVESKKANGVSCTSAAECESDYCDAVSHVCAVKPVEESKKADGVSCTSAAECESDYCDAATQKCASQPVSDLDADLVSKVEEFCGTGTTEEEKTDCIHDWKEYLIKAKEKTADCYDKIDAIFQCYYQHKEMNDTELNVACKTESKASALCIRTNYYDVYYMNQNQDYCEFDAILDKDEKNYSSVSECMAAGEAELKRNKETLSKCYDLWKESNICWDDCLDETALTDEVRDCNDCNSLMEVHSACLETNYPAE